MKEIIYNYDYLTDEEINQCICRAKMIIENSKNELLVVYSHQNYFLIGGHVENNETFSECIVREIKEEAGVEIQYEERKPFFSIKYLCKDYPTNGENTKSITNYYYINYDLVPNTDNINLTEDEIDGNFKLEYIHRDNVIKVLTDNLNTCTRRGVVRDTIEVIKEYLTLNNH